MEGMEDGSTCLPADYLSEHFFIIIKYTTDPGKVWSFNVVLSGRVQGELAGAGP